MIKISIPGITMKVVDRKDHLEVSLLIVAEEKRGNGLGTRAIRALQQFGRVIRLTAVPGICYEMALHRFYRRLGFHVTGKDAAGHTEFVWWPNPAIAVRKS